MPAYWRCLKWARAQSFAELERRAADGVVYTQLLEQPDKYRGKLLRLRLHIRRVLDWEAPKNSAGVRRVYEAWGWTDESKSHPTSPSSATLPAGHETGRQPAGGGGVCRLFSQNDRPTPPSTRTGRRRCLWAEWSGCRPLPRRSPGRQHSDWFWIYAVGIPAVLLILSGDVAPPSTSAAE